MPLITSIKTGDFDFVLHGGDMSDGGLIKEFDIFQDVMKNLETPYFTVIGNHDLLATDAPLCRNVWRRNYTFEYKECKFIFLIMWYGN